MKKFVKNILLFAFAFFIFDKVLYLIFPILPYFEKDKRLENIIDSKLKKEIIILGSSRGARDVIACQIEDSLGVSTYNLSYPGSNIEFHEFLLRTLLNFNNKPDIVILVVDEQTELLQDSTLKFRLDRLYPLVKYDYIYNEIKKYTYRKSVSDLFALSRLNKRNFDFKQLRFNSLDTILPCGSMPVSFQKENYKFEYNNSLKEYHKENELENKILAFERFQNLCLINDIKLIIVFPPNFGIHSPIFENRIIELTKPGVEHFIYDTINPIYKNNLYYYDYGHLKNNGAKIFSNEIIKYLKLKYNFSPFSASFD